MKKIFYILDDNGEFLSEDGKKRYRALTGQALYQYLRTEEGKKKYFDVWQDDDRAVMVGVEVPPERAKIYEAEKRRRRYLYSVMEELDISITSLDVVLDAESEMVNALTQVMVCGECKSPYRRYTWVKNGEKKGVWRCECRTKFKKKYCKHSPAIEERYLHETIMNGVMSVAQENTNLLTVLKQHIGQVIGNTVVDNSLEIQVRINEIDKEFKALIDSVTADMVDGFDQNKVGELMREKQELQKKLQEIREMKGREAVVHSRLSDIYTVMDGLKNHPLIYDDAIVRNLIECIVVESKESIEKAEINVEDKELILKFCERREISLSNEFWMLGNLQKEISTPMLSLYGDKTITYKGSESEKKKYELFQDLISKIEEFNDVIDYFAKIDNLYKVSFIVSNIGTTFDEDIDIRIYIDRGHIIKPKNIPQPGLLFLDEVVDNEAPKLLFAGYHDADIDDYSNYPKWFSDALDAMSLPFSSAHEEIGKKRRKYTNLVENIFCYDIHESEGEDILCFNIPYLKQNTKMFFPSFLFFSTIPEYVRYEIRSKHSPNVYTNKFKVVTK